MEISDEKLPVNMCMCFCALYVSDRYFPTSTEGEIQIDYTEYIKWINHPFPSSLPSPSPSIVVTDNASYTSTCDKACARSRLRISISFSSGEKHTRRHRRETICFREHLRDAKEENNLSPKPRYGYTLRAFHGLTALGIWFFWKASTYSD